MPTYIEEGKFAGSLYLAAQASETFLFEYGTGLDVAWGKLNTSAPTVPPSPSFSSSSISSVSGSETIIPIQVEAKEDRDGTDKAGSRKYNNDDDNDNDATADADAPVNMYSLLTLHAKWFNAKFPFEISRNTNSNLLAFLVSELSHAPSPSASASSVSASAKNHTFIVGHDNNVVAMGAMLGLSWDPAPYPKLASPPGCMMRFDAVTITFSSSSADSSQVARRALADDGTDISENTINDDSRNTTDDGGDVNVGAVGRQGIYVKATLSYKIFDSVASPSLTVPVIFDATGTNLIPFKDFVNAAIQAIDSKCVRPYVHDAVLRAAAKYTGDGDDRN